MQIFATDPDPILCAQALDNRRLHKMMVETAQLLCNVVTHHYTVDTPYKPLHLAHPASVWAASHMSHAHWLVQHLIALKEERNHRGFGPHATSQHIPFFLRYIPISPPPTFFYNGAKRRSLDLDFTHLPVHDAYKEYLYHRWAFANPHHKPVWTNRLPPDWYIALIKDDAHSL